eukprot:scaffold2118_cov53-Cylindrotheca_fusiformis.AAC.1
MEKEKGKSPKKPKEKHKKGTTYIRSRSEIESMTGFPGTREVFPGTREEELAMLDHAIRNPHETLVMPKNRERTKSGLTGIEEIQKDHENHMKRKTVRTKHSSAALCGAKMFGRNHVQYDKNKDTRYSEKFRMIYFPQKPEEGEEEEEERSSEVLDPTTMEKVTKTFEEFKQQQNLQIGDIKEVFTETDMENLDTMEMSEYSMKQHPTQAEDSDGSSTIIPSPQNLELQNFEQRVDQTKQYIQTKFESHFTKMENLIKTMQQNSDTKDSQIKILITQNEILQKRNSEMSQEISELQQDRTSNDNQIQILRTAIEEMKTKIREMNNRLQRRDSEEIQVIQEHIQLARTERELMETTIQESQVERAQMDMNILESERILEIASQDNVSETIARIETAEKNFQRLNDAINTRMTDVKTTVTKTMEKTVAEQKQLYEKQQLEGLSTLQLKANERQFMARATTIAKEQLELLEKDIETKFAKTTDRVTMELENLEETANEIQTEAISFIDSLPQTVEEETQQQLLDFRKSQRREMEKLKEEATTEMQQQLTSDDTYKYMVGNLKQSMQKSLSDREQNLNADRERKMKEFDEYIGKERMKPKNLVNQLRLQMQQAAVKEQENFKDDIQLAAGELTSKIAAMDPAQLYTLDEPEESEPSSNRGQNMQATPTPPPDSTTRPKAMWQQDRTQDAGTLAEQLDTKFKVTKDSRQMTRDDALLAFYNQIKDKMDQKGLPLKAFDDLQARGNCLPEGATSHFGQSTIDTIAQSRDLSQDPDQTVRHRSRAP